MKLVIGGYSQGKEEYVFEKYHPKEEMVWKGELPKDAKADQELVVISHFHDWVKRRLANSGCPEEEIWLFLEHCENCIIICDEIGNGIVPNDPLEREYRERTGRILVQLAERAEEVERVICGIGQRIK